MHSGIFHNFTVPDQLPVAKILVLGAIRTCEMGLSSPICDPRLENFWRSSDTAPYIKSKDLHLHFIEDFFAYINDTAKLHFAV